MRISHFKSFLSCILFLSCPYLQAWESNSWKLSEQNDDVFNEVIAMDAYVAGVDNYDKVNLLSVSCDPSNVGKSNSPTMQGPLYVLLAVDFDIWFGYNEPIRNLKIAGRYQVDSKPTRKIKSNNSNIMLPKDIKESNKLFLFHTKNTDTNKKLLLDLMSGSKLVLKPWEEAEVSWTKVSFRDGDLKSDKEKVDLNKLLEDADISPLSDRVVRFSLNNSQKSIEKVIAFCEPYVKNWERNFVKALGHSP